MRVAVLVHTVQQGAELVKTLSEELEGCCHGFRVTGSSGRDCVDEERDKGCAAGFDSDRDEVEPRLVEGASEGCERRKVLQTIGGFVGEDGAKIPEAHACVCGDWGELEVGADFEKGDGYRRRDPLRCSVSE